MDTVTLEVKSRSIDTPAKEIRDSGMIPGVFYGTKQENKNLTVDYQTFRRVFEKSGGNTVLELDIDGKEKINVLVHDLQQDPVTDKFTHIDFKFVDLNKEVTTEVPLVVVGESKAVRELGGTLQTRELVEVKCMAKIIPSTIEFDISSLEDFHSSIHIKDINLPKGVEILDDPELRIASVLAPRAEEEEVATEEAVAGGEPTVEGGEKKSESSDGKEGKKEENANG